MTKGLIKTKYYLPYNPTLKERSRELRKNMTIAEKKLWFAYLRRLPLPVLRQKIIDNYIVDFYCARIKLVIEIDGDSHFEQNAREYDFMRTKILEGYGLKVLRFTNFEVLKNFTEVCEKISKLVEKEPPQA